MDEAALAVGRTVHVLGVEAVDAASVEGEPDRRAGRRELNPPTMWVLARGGRPSWRASLPRIVVRSLSTRTCAAALAAGRDGGLELGGVGQTDLRAENGEGRLGLDGGLRPGLAEFDAFSGMPARMPPGGAPVTAAAAALMWRCRARVMPRPPRGARRRGAAVGCSADSYGCIVDTRPAAMGSPSVAGAGDVDRNAPRMSPPRARGPGEPS